MGDPFQSHRNSWYGSQDQNRNDPLRLRPFDRLGDGSVYSSDDDSKNGLDDSRGCHGVKAVAMCADDEDRCSKKDSEHSRLPVPTVE